MECVEHGSHGAFGRGWTEFVEIRIPCGCACGMTEVPVIEEPEYREPTVVPAMRPSVSPWGREEIIAAMRAWHARYGKQPRANDWIRVSEEHPTSQRVAVVFGSWNAGIAAAGFEPKRGRQAGGWKPKPLIPRGFHGS